MASHTLHEATIEVARMLAEQERLRLGRIQIERDRQESARQERFQQEARARELAEHPEQLITGVKRGRSKPLTKEELRIEKMRKAYRSVGLNPQF
jgi:hypothetical protein